MVISPPEYSTRFGDLLLLALTSKPQPEPELLAEHWQQAGLLAPTLFNPIAFCLASSVVERRLGAISLDDRPRAAKALSILIAPEFRI